MAAIVPHVVGTFLAVLYAFNAAADAGKPGVVFTQFFRRRQHCFQEFEWNDIHTFKLDRFDAGHTDVLNHAQVCEVFLAESHPETGAAERREVFYQTFQFFVVNQVGAFRADFRIVDVFPDFVRLGFDPLAVFPVFAALRYLADIDFRVKVGSEGLAVVAGIGIDDVQFVDFIEIVFGGIGCKHAGHAGVETATQQCLNTFFAETVLIGPLPGVFEFGFVFRFVVGGVHVVHTRFQAGIHDGQVLVRKRHVDYEAWLELPDQRHRFSHVVGIHAGGFYFFTAISGVNGVCDGLAFRHRAGSKHDVAEHIAVLGAFVGNNTAYAACADNEDF